MSRKRKPMWTIWIVGRANDYSEDSLIAAYWTEHEAQAHAASESGAYFTYVEIEPLTVAPPAEPGS